MAPGEMLDRAGLLDDIVAMSERLDRDGVPALKTPLPAFCEMASLVLPAEHRWLSNTCWLAGGGVLKWLERGRSSSRTPMSMLVRQSGDLDLYFPSRSALSDTLLAMMDQGSRLDCLRLRQRRLIRRRKVPASQVLSAARVADSAAREVFAASLRSRDDLAAIEAVTPRGARCQLIAMLTYADPLQVIEDFDYSICQFAIDAEHLYATETAWQDLLARRNRLMNSAHFPPMLLRRLVKYAVRGYLPRWQVPPRHRRAPQ